MEFDKKIKEILQNLGLTEIQSNFYLTLLKRGEASVSKIAKDLGINRTNSYNILEKLKELDLIWEENTTKGKLIHAKSYEPIIKALENKSKTLSNFKDSVENLIPVFNSYSLDKNSFAPKIRTYEGKSAINNMTDEILNSSKEILLFTNQESEKTFSLKVNMKNL